jgi:hypothetical protein
MALFDAEHGRVAPTIDDLPTPSSASRTSAAFERASDATFLAKLGSGQAAATPKAGYFNAAGKRIPGTTTVLSRFRKPGVSFTGAYAELD